MNQTVILSTEIDSQVKKAAMEFCRRRGLKLRHLVEQALVEQLEDEMDIEAYHQRKAEGTVPLEEILSGLKKARKS
jgi:hypothetical protein